jgi:hypothetical protein
MQPNHKQKNKQTNDKTNASLTVVGDALAVTARGRGDEAEVGLGGERIARLASLGLFHIDALHRRALSLAGEFPEDIVIC